MDGEQHRGIGSADDHAPLLPHKGIPQHQITEDQSPPRNQTEPQRYATKRLQTDAEGRATCYLVLGNDVRT